MPDEKIDEKRPAHAENELRKMQQRVVDDTVAVTNLRPRSSDTPSGCTCASPSAIAMSKNSWRSGAWKSSMRRFGGG
jgi:hypothetical protein